MATSHCPPMVPFPPTTTTTGVDCAEDTPLSSLVVDDPMEHLTHAETQEDYRLRTRFDHHAMDGIDVNQLDVLRCASVEGEEMVDVFIVNNSGAIPSMPGVFRVNVGRWVTTSELAKFLLITIISLKNISIDALFTRKGRDSLMVHNECIDFLPHAVTGQETIILQHEILGALCAIRSTFFNYSSSYHPEIQEHLSIVSVDMESADVVYEQPEFDDLVPSEYRDPAGLNFLEPDFVTNEMLLA
jgi:hypothetical protein